MACIKLTCLRDEYNQLFASCVVDPAEMNEVKSIRKKSLTTNHVMRR
jgi:lysozyme family protein